MTLNLNALQQKQDQLIVTIDEIVEALRKLPGTGYQTLQYYDRNGNLVQKQIPNIGQLIEQFRQGVNSQMAKTVYVDQQNGSDTSGDGSQNAPFKSLQKAINSVPNGGAVTIILLTDYELDSDTVVSNRFVLITGTSTEHRKIVFQAYQYDDQHYAYRQFRLGNLAGLRFHYIDFELGTPPANFQPLTLGLISAIYSQNTSIVLGACSITLDGTQHFIESTPYGTPLQVGIYGSNIKTNGSYVIFNTYRPCLLNKNGNTIDDNTKWVSSSDYLIS